MFNMTPLKKIADDVLYGYTAPAEASGSHRFIRITDITDNGTLKQVAAKYVTPGSTSVKKYAVKEGDILIARSGSVGRPYLVTECHNAVFASYLIRFRINKHIADSEYIFYYALSPMYKEYINSHSRGGAIKNINAKQLGNLSVPLPSLIEQRRIVARIKECMERVEEIEKLRAAAIEEANYIFRAHCEEIFASGWPETAVGDLITEKPSNGIFKRRKDFGKGTLLANVKDLYGDQVIHTEQLERVQASGKEIQQFKLEPGDILVNRSSLKREGTGRSCVFIGHIEPVLFECHIMRLRLDKKKLHPALFAAFMNSPTGLNRILNRAKTATMTTWNQTDLQSIMIPVPPIAEQDKLVDELNNLKPIADELRISMETIELKYLRESILRKAFAGEL